MEKNMESEKTSENSSVVSKLETEFNPLNSFKIPTSKLNKDIRSIKPPNLTNLTNLTNKNADSQYNATFSTNHGEENPFPIQISIRCTRRRMSLPN